MSNSNLTLTAERLKEVLRYDAETGHFYCLIGRGSNAKIGMRAGSIYDGYIRIKIDKVLYRAHRLAWLYVTGKWPLYEVDHIDGIRSNNQWANLRDATKSQNLQNQKKACKSSQTGILGVSKNGSGFSAYIRVDGKQRYLGTFKTPEQAQEIYLKEKRAIHSHNTL